ncbi:MAG: Sensor protein CpxA [Syntrophorhabdus sp. PtaU1.Bin058]|nr:MAG: Sensor protein CpxA [Syntrophorhabdus sp. PtaU1.Bin058]
MTRRNIFVKIYLCFWLATLLIMAAQIMLDRLMRPASPDPGYLLHVLSPTLAMHGYKALDYYILGDRDAMAKETLQLKRLSGIDAYVLDEKDKDINNGPAPREVLEIARQARKTGKAEFSSTRKRTLLALPMRGSDGNHYCIVGDVPAAAFDHSPPPPPPQTFSDPSVHRPHEKPGLPPFGLGIGPPMFLLGHGPPPFASTSLSLFRLFITLIISAGICYLLARYLTSPILKLRDVTRRFAGGELTARMGGSNSIWKDELSELADDFDRMAERIESLMTQQRQLISDISHELRSPLARLTVAVELVRRQTGAEVAPALDRIEREAMVLNEMIGQVLAMTRFESNVETIPMAPVDLERFLKEIANDANFEAHARNCTVRITESTACSVFGNEEWLRRAVENVVRNAIRYTHADTTVDIGLRQTVSDQVMYAEISIRDHGPGVPNADLPFLFRPFYRVSNARDRQTGGTGLGLAITERTVTLHHGSVTASNAPEGGLIVVIRLPSAITGAHVAPSSGKARRASPSHS